MAEYRCTRSELYDHDCSGHADFACRQGHYVQADNVALALAEMRRRFPDEQRFTAVLWQGYAVGPTYACNGVQWGPVPQNPNYARAAERGRPCLNSGYTLKIPTKMATPANPST